MNREKAMKKLLKAGVILICISLFFLSKNATGDEDVKKNNLVIGRVSDNPKKHYKRLEPIVDYVVANMKDLGITKGSVKMTTDNSSLIQYLKEGAGSEFHFVMPFKLRKNSGQKSKLKVFPDSDEHDKKTETVPQQRVLLIEDDLLNQKFLQIGLEEKAYMVDIAEDGKKAIKMWEENNYDVILMDIQLPAMNGFKITEIIREKEKNSKDHIIIIAVTAFAMKEDREKCLKAGMDGYLSKPVNVVELIQKINELTSSDVLNYS